MRPDDRPKVPRQTTDEELSAVTVGERKPHDSKVHLARYDPDWPATFRVLEKRIRAALRDKVRLLEHVGSTAVPGLPAKPKIETCCRDFAGLQPERQLPWGAGSGLHMSDAG